MDKGFGNYRVGDRIKFLEDGSYLTGVIEQLTEFQIIIKPDIAGTKFSDSYRICLSRSDIAVKLVEVSSFEEMIVNEDGSVSL